MTESDGRRSSAWASLVKVDDSGSARAVRWETLANLIPTDSPARPHIPPANPGPQRRPESSRSRL